ncbi:hypothetical protein VNO78_11531 [Psophocarpus tetragonolobus]|uniref:Uncharacterized protein n=1 Tax=Psophocarpus tetragonolobus TaxID=3891 RepID=A0AAN9SLL7_PSOTE
MESNKKNAIPLSFENKEVVFIKPSKPTPSSVLSLSSIDNDLNFFIQALLVYRSASANQNSPTYIDSNTNAINTTTTKRDPAKVIKEAFSKGLSYYYPLAGKLVKHADGKLRINCTSDGVPFQEAFCNCNLSCVDYLDGEDIEMATQFGVDFPSEDEYGNQYPMAFKLTKFMCGGFTFAWRFNHSLFDGTGITQFLVSVAELAGGESEPSVKPVWERETLVGKITSEPMKNPMENANVAVSPLLPTAEYVHACFKVDKESIARLKTSLMKDIDLNTMFMKKGFTTFECLAGYIWRARARALKLNNDGETMLNITLGVRALLDDPLPTGYYGNAIVESYVKLVAKELMEQPLLEVVKHIRQSLIPSLNNDYCINFIDTIETKPMRFDYESGAITILTDWRHLGSLDKIDFGWKEPINMIPIPSEVSGPSGMYDILPPSKVDPSMTGGVRFFISLPSAAMFTFKEEMKLLTRNDPKLNL